MSTASATVTVHVPLVIRRRGGRKVVITPAGETCGSIPQRARVNASLVKALARAHRWKRQLEEGLYASITEMAAAERIDRGYVGNILRLTLLAPDIVEGILNGHQPDIGLSALLKPFPLEWPSQRAWLAARDASGSDSTRTSAQTICESTTNNSNVRFWQSRSCNTVQKGTKWRHPPERPGALPNSISSKAPRSNGRSDLQCGLQEKTDSPP